MKADLIKNFYYHFFHTSHLYHHAMIIASTFDQILINLNIFQCRFW